MLVPAAAAIADRRSGSVGASASHSRAADFINGRAPAGPAYPRPCPVVRPRLSASIAAVSTLRTRPSRLLRIAITVSCQRCEMKNPTFLAELHKKLGAPSSEAMESLRLLKAFLKLAPRQRYELLEMAE